jgi:hypothetical protein
MTIKESKRSRMTGKGNRGGYLALPHHMTSSERWGNLSGNATKLVVELARQFKGTNNGDLSVPWSRMQRRGWRSKSTLWAAINEAISAGFIKMTRQGGRHGLCNLFAVTWAAVDECKGKHHHAVERVASNDWQKTENAFAMRTGAFAIRTGCLENEQKAA